MLVPAVAIALAAFVVVLVGLLVVVGTGGGDDPKAAALTTSTVTPSPTASRTATATPSPTPTATAPPSATAPPTATPTSPPATATATPSPTVTPRTPASEAAAFCASAGTVDAPATVLQNAPRLSNGDRPLAWRCWEGKVLVCEPGAQVFPCGKMDLSRTPNQATQAYCHDMPDAPTVPKVVTGQATIYDWGCQAGSPVMVRQVVAPSQVDARGFIVGVWNELKL